MTLPRLLTIDDDEVDRVALRRALRTGGLECDLSEAATATEGIDQARNGRFDCILLDYMLPERDGIEVLRVLLAEPLAPPVIVLTGHGDETLAVELMKAGASDYIPKSALSPGRLVHAVRQTMRLHRVEAESRHAALKHTDQLRALADATRELNAVLSVGAVLDRVTQRASALLHASVSCARAVRARNARGQPRDSLEPSAEALFATVSLLRGPERAHADALRTHPVLQRLVALGFPRPERCWLAAPMASRDGERIGVVHVCDAEGEAFTDDDEAILVQFAQSASIALENAWLYEAARDAVRARDDMISIVSHDLRNPLNVVLMGATRLRPHGALLPGRSAEMLDRIARAARRMTGLVDDLLDVTKIDAGTLTIEPKNEALAPVVEEALDQLRLAAGEKQIALASNVDPDLPNVAFDRHRMLQVLSNLLGNALKFTPVGGAVTVAARRLPDVVQVTVRDTGVGIAAEDIPHLFDRYWQVKQTSTLGAGLGLFITKGIVEAHGGRISVESDIGRGTTFSYTLPVQRPEEGAST